MFGKMGDKGVEFFLVVSHGRVTSEKILFAPLEMSGVIWEVRVFERF